MGREERIQTKRAVTVPTETNPAFTSSNCNRPDATQELAYLSITGTPGCI